jgi:hypothetical protein
MTFVKDRMIYGLEFAASSVSRRDRRANQTVIGPSNHFSQPQRFWFFRWHGSCSIVPEGEPDSNSGGPAAVAATGQRATGLLIIAARIGWPILALAVRQFGARE